jgi:uncharacterized membrane protein
MNRRAAFGVDVLRATFIVLLVSAIFLGIISFLFEDLDLLWNAPISSWLLFILAGLIHFLLGWTLLNISQRRIGAARTGALVGTAPLFATIIAAVTLGEWLKPLVFISPPLRRISQARVRIHPILDLQRQQGYDQPSSGWPQRCVGLSVLFLCVMH